MPDKHLIMIHGRNFKPKKDVLENSWFDALRHGVGRDFKSQLEKLNAVKKSMVYYGDISNQYLKDIGRSYDEAADHR